MVVYVSKARNYKDSQRALKDVLDPINLKIDKNVFIKPNIVSPHSPNSGIITNTKFLEQIIQYLFDNTNVKKIFIGEIPRVGLTSEEVYRSLNLYKLEREDVEIIDLSAEKTVKLKWEYGEIEIPKIALDNFYINVPKLKTHILTTVTIGLKNQKGLLNEKTKIKSHLLGLHRPIAQLAKTISPDLTVVDGITGISGTGPGRSGKKVKPGLVLAGRNVVEVDAAACKLVGFKPEEIEHLKIAHEIGLGSLDTQIIGKYNVFKFEKPKRYFKRFNIYLWPTDSACSYCTDLFGEIKRIAYKNPIYLFKLFLYGYYGRLDLLIGKKNKIPENHGKVICVGSCTYKLAKEKGLAYVEGCPPKPEDFLRILNKRMMKNETKR